MAQLSLWNSELPGIDESISATTRTPLEHGAWVDVARNWLRGQARVFDLLRGSVTWLSERRVMYGRDVEVPRQYAVLRDRGVALHPVLGAMGRALDARYETSFDRLSLALYRDGRDSVAWHGDYVARRMPEAVVATISVGAPRKFLLRPKHGGESFHLSLGWGDLVVMGGTCQRTYEHAIPKTAQADPRIAIMYRPVWREAPSSRRGPIVR